MRSITSRHLHSARQISEEDISRYCKGGYHPVRIGDQFHHGKFRVVRKLGYGADSTVWLAFSQQ
ncbi:hypothetical protein IMZ48_36875 [Candidatus Bathyarchaeota archaeon]|nr:hypothetical protein [Candidatus Bathyarchaeota archaeon]